MTQENAIALEGTQERAETPEDDIKVFGFWVYLMTDLVIFSVLFAAFVVLRDNTFGGPSGKDLFRMSSALAETLCLLTSSFTCALATLAVYKRRAKTSIGMYFITFALGVAFLYLELTEFSQFYHEGNSWHRSGFLSAYYALVSTHGFHVTLGLIWMAITMFCIGFRGLSDHMVSQSVRVSLFWHFLDIVWIFIFTIVYSMGHLI